MPTAEQAARGYEELANGYAEIHDEPMRDRFLVLAADSLLSAGQPERAEGLRRRLLQHNPHHMLRPYTSLAEAMKSGDVRTYVAGLRRNYPPEKLGQLADMMNRARAAKGVPAAPTAASPIVPGNLRLAEPEPTASRPLAPTPRPLPPSVAPPRPTEVYRVLPPVGRPGLDGPSPADPEPVAGALVSVALFWLVLAAGMCWLVYVLARPFVTLW